MPDTDAPAGPDVVAAALGLAGAVRGARRETERARRTPAWLAEEIAKAGLSQLYLPRAVGGPEAPPLVGFRAIEELSKADGSVGWCAMIASIMASHLAKLPTEAGRELAGTPADYRASGSGRPGGPSAGRAWPVAGGWRISGRRNFASGIDNARWLYCTCLEMDGDAPRTTPAGRPALRMLWVPREAATVLDTWSTMGMRGTGSQDFRVDGAFVPERRSAAADAPPVQPGPLYHPRSLMAVQWTLTAANALGIARGALDDLVAIAAEASTLDTRPLRDRPMVQARVGEAEAIVGAARAYVLEAVGRLWDELRAGAAPSDHAVARARLAIVHGMRESARAVDIAFHAAGTNAIYTDLPLEAAFRDVHVAVQHGAALPGYYESAGKVLLGLRPTDPGW